MDCEDFMDLMIVEPAQGNVLHHGRGKEVVVPIQPSKPSKQIIPHVSPLLNVLGISMTRNRIMESFSEYWINL